MNVKRILSLLFACCMIIGMLPVVSLAEGSAELQNETAAFDYHVFTKLPTQEAPATDGVIYLGAPFEVDGATVFYGINSIKQGSGTNTHYTTTNAVDQQYTITVRYAGKDDTYGDYYNLVFTQPDGAAYAVAYDAGYFSQNKIQDTGAPSGGWAYKHRLYWDDEAQIFYHRPSADQTVMKGLKISTASYKLFTETVANLKTQSASYVPARLYEICASDNVAGSDSTHTWSGTCTCGRKYDYEKKAGAEVAEGYHLQTVLPTSDAPELSGDLYLGATLAGTFYGMSSAISNTAASTSTDVAKQYTITVRYGGEDTTCGSYYNVIFQIPGGAAYTFAYSGGSFTQNKIQDNGEPSGGWADKHKLYFDQESNLFYHVIETADETVMKGLKLSTSSHKIFTETVQNLKIESASYVPVRLVAACASDHVAGSDETHQWSGACVCGYKFDYEEKTVAPESTGFHPVTELPTASAPELGGNLRLGAVIAGEFYGMSGASTQPSGSDRYFPASANGTELCDITVLYGGNDATYGDYYYILFTLTNGTAYALSYSGGYISQNKLQDNGEPVDGWQDKNKMFYDQEDQIFYRVIVAGEEVVMKGLKISTASYKIFTDTLAKLKTPSTAYVPVRLYAACSSDGVAGSDSTHHWSGICSCGEKMDYEAHDQVSWNVKDEDGHGKVCSCGYVLAQTTAHDMPDDWTVDPDTGIECKICQSCGFKTLKDHTHEYTTIEYDNNNHWGQCICGKESETVAHTMGQWTAVTKPMTLTDKGVDQRICEGCAYSESKETTLSASQFGVTQNPPVSDVPFYFGATQLQVENTPTYFFKGAWAPSTYQNMDVTTQMQSAAPMYAQAVNGGYKLYFYAEGVKTYLVIDKMTIAGKEGVFVQPVTEAKQASTFMWNEKHGTFQTNVIGKGDYYIGLYSTVDAEGKLTAYTKLQALLVSGLGRDDRHPAKVYQRTYEEIGHEHTYGKWVNKSYATHLNNQAVQERACTECDCVQARVAMVSVKDYIPATNAPGGGVGFYLGATQLQVDEMPTYFFKGSWAPKKYQSMDVTTDMKKAALMYAQAVEGGYKLYFYNEGVKTYLTISHTTVAGDEGVYVQPVTSSRKASVFTWNQEYSTFQTYVEGKGDYYIGNYTHNETNYTKLSALLVTGLGREDRHPAVVYVSRYIHDVSPNTGDFTPVVVIGILMALSATALIVLVIGKKKYI